MWQDLGRYPSVRLMEPLPLRERRWKKAHGHSKWIGIRHWASLGVRKLQHSLPIWTMQKSWFVKTHLATFWCELVHCWCTQPRYRTPGADGKCRMVPAGIPAPAGRKPEYEIRMKSWHDAFVSCTWCSEVSNLRAAKAWSKRKQSVSGRYGAAAWR